MQSYVCVCLVYVWPFSTPWTVARQASLSVGILQERTLEWVAISFSRVSSRPRNWTRSPTLQADSWPSEPPGKPFRAMKACYLKCYGDTQEHCSQISLSYLPLFLPYGPGYSSDKSFHFLFCLIGLIWASLVAQTVVCPGFDTWVRKTPEEGSGNPLQYSCLENSMEKGAWWAAVHGVTKSQAQQRD